MIIGFTPIYKRDLFNVIIEIYYQTIRVIIKDKFNNRYSSNKFLGLRFKNWSDIIALESAKIENVLIICVDGNIW